MGAPSTDWAEIIGVDEQARHQRFAEQLVGIQDRVSEKEGEPGRALHRKQIVGVRAEIEVLSGLPEYAAQGLFASAGTYEGVARLSNGGIERQRDITPDIRGFALSVRGVSGPGALAATTDRQDFALINRPSFGFVDSQFFTKIVVASAKSQSGIMKAFVEEFGLGRGPIEAAKMGRDLFRPFSGFATARFYSAAPIKCGPYAAKVRLVPRQHDKRLNASLDYTKDFAARLAQGDVSYDLQLQFFVSESKTPIENGAIDWKEADAPFVTVATVTFPQQDVDSDEGQTLAAAIEKDKFDPWAALADHRPLGEIMRARKVAYFPSTQHRK